MIAAEGWIAAAVAAAAIGLFVLALRASAADAPAPWPVQALTSPQAAAILCGAMLGWAAPAWLGRPFGLVLLPGLAFFAGWMGVAAGCGLDLRAIRGSYITGFLFEAGAVLATLLAVFSASLLGGMLPAIPDLGAPALFVFAAVCVAGHAMPAAGGGAGRGTARPGGGRRGGFWVPTTLAVAAAVLGAVGVGLEPSQPLQLSLAGLPDPQPLPIQLEGLPARLLWGLAAGCLTGFLADMATRVDFAPGGLYPPLAGVVLLSAGLAGAIGVEGLLVGAVGGFWLINATLRRLDILGVLDRGARLPRLAVPFLAAWLAGSSLGRGSFDTGVFFIVAAGVIVLRPFLRLATARAVEGPLDRRRRRRSPPSRVDRIGIDEFGLLIGVLLLKPLEPAAGVGGLAGVLAAALVLGGVRCWWGSRGRAAAEGPEVDQARPARASRPG